MLGSVAIQQTKSSLEEFSYIWTVYPARVGSLVDSCFDDIGKAVPAVLPFRAL